MGKIHIDRNGRSTMILDPSHTGSKTANDAMDYMEQITLERHLLTRTQCQQAFIRVSQNATPKGCYRAGPDDEAIRAAKSGKEASPRHLPSG
ncbi:hypothetical protein O9929_13155 [Vibrio lentus]|nr:hypothetical protein [Vibrio lentus]